MRANQSQFRVAAGTGERRRAKEALSFVFLFCLATPRGMQDLRSPTGDRTRGPRRGSTES